MTLNTMYFGKDLSNLKITEEQAIQNLRTLAENKERHSFASHEENQAIVYKGFFSWKSLDVNVVENTFRKIKVIRDLFIETILTYSSQICLIEDFFNDAARELKVLADTSGSRELRDRYLLLINQFAIDDQSLTNNLIKLGCIQTYDEFEVPANFPGHPMDIIQNTIHRAYTILLSQEHCHVKQKWMDLDKIYYKALKNLKIIKDTGKLDQVTKTILAGLIEKSWDLKKEASPPPPPLPPPLPKISGEKKEDLFESFLVVSKAQLSKPDTTSPILTQQSLELNIKKLRKTPCEPKAKFTGLPKLTNKELALHLRNLKKTAPMIKEKKFHHLGPFTGEELAQQRYKLAKIGYPQEKSVHEWFKSHENSL